MVKPLWLKSLSVKGQVVPTPFLPVIKYAQKLCPVALKVKLLSFSYFLCENLINHYAGPEKIMLPIFLIAKLEHNSLLLLLPQINLNFQQCFTIYVAAERHKCERKCHSGECGPCEGETTLLCVCGTKKKVFNCTDVIKFTGRRLSFNLK